MRYQNMSTEGATPGEGASSAETQSGLDENVAGALAYVLGLISGIFFFVTEDENEFVRFHALQSIIFSVAAFVLYWVINTVLVSMFFGRGMLMPGGGLLFSLLSLVTSLVSLALLGVWLFVMFQAYTGERYKLPVIGDFAEKNL
jgi:uncharacterized membrane protein